MAPYRISKSVTVTLLACFLYAIAGLPAVAAPSVDGPTDGMGGAVVNQNGDGSHLWLKSKSDFDSLAKDYYQSASKPPQPPFRKYALTSICTGYSPGQDGSDNSCSAMYSVCNRGATRNSGTLGPAMRVWSLRVDGQGQPINSDLKPEPNQAWKLEGLTCVPSDIPGVSNVVTTEMVLTQFRDTKFSQGNLLVQPVGNVTLVQLPTFFQMEWPEVGFRPGEIDTATLVGRAVRIKPTLKSINYLFGDGSASGPTQSLGGPYPNGDIVHTYRQAQEVTVRVDVIYGGQFSVDGSEWIDIPGEATVEGTPQTLRVAEAKARLYNN